MKLRDTEPFTWHRLVNHPDHLHHRGPTAFWASWHKSVWGEVVETRDTLESTCPVFGVSGPGRVTKYLNTDVVEQ